MRMTGRLYKGPSVLEEKVVEVDDSAGTYQDRLERCLLEVCGLLAIEVPIWLSKTPGSMSASGELHLTPTSFSTPCISIGSR